MKLSIEEQLLLRAATEEVDLWDATLEVADVLPSGSRESEVRSVVTSAIRSLIDRGLIQLVRQPLRGGMNVGEPSSLSESDIAALAATDEAWANDIRNRKPDSEQVALQPTAKGLSIAETALTDL
ncbi:MAG: hypothetical protein E6J13_08560 [Chloroflexi bacterium]|nr:MAG: hypothetical protein E6J13_08560 [Chloroflexota bacterium]